MEQILLYSNLLLWIIQIVVLFFLFLIFRQFGEVYLSSAQAISKDGLTIGQKIPEFESFSCQTNKTLTSSITSGMPTLFVFISPKCKACTDLIPHWNQAYDKNRKNIQFIIVGLGEKEEFDQWNNDNLIEGDFILDPKHEIFAKFKVRVTPFAYMIDKYGMIKAKGLCNGESHLKELLASINNDFSNLEINDGMKNHV